MTPAGRMRQAKGGPAFPPDVIDNRQDAEAAAIGQGVADEVEAPAVIRGLRHGHRAACPNSPLAPAMLAPLQPLLRYGLRNILRFIMIHCRSSMMWMRRLTAIAGNRLPANGEPNRRRLAATAIIAARSVASRGRTLR